MTQNLILVINCGSSSIKFALINPACGATHLSGLVENLFSANSKLHYSQQGGVKQSSEIADLSHESGVKAILTVIEQLDLAKDITGIGHRVVHGGESYANPTLIDRDVIDTISHLIKLAPLHNPANLAGILAAKAVFPDLPHVAIFDTAFHQTMPKHAFLYGLPYELYQEHGIRRYGFHGSSHYFIAQNAPQFIGKPVNECQIISAHLGNGCSVAAISGGKSVDTSMGMTPLEGLIMGTRCGDVDPGLVFHLTEQLGYTLTQVNDLYNRQSGLLGLSQHSNDCRTLEHDALKGNQQSLLALDTFCYRIARYIASLTASLKTLDAVVFTGGIGENSPLVRQKVLDNLAIFNFVLNEEKNNLMVKGKNGIITRENSSNAIVIATNEEWVIAQKTANLLIQI